MLLALTLISALHLSAPADSVSGSWQLKNEVQGVEWTETCAFKQAGTVLSGTCTGEEGKAWPLTGEVKDGKVSFQHPSNYQGQDIVIYFTGPVGTATAMKGAINVKPLEADGSFTATPVAAKK